MLVFYASMLHFFLQSAHLHTYAFISNDFDLRKIWVMQNLQERNDCVTRGPPVQRTTSSHPSIVCSCLCLVTDKDSSDTEIDNGTDTKDVKSFMPNFFPYCAGSGQMFLR
jgi:hypothetical protein